MDPILIAGAGPVGLTMAAELARYGVPVRIIDRAEHPTTTSKALVVWSRTLELMDRMGCTRAFLDAGLRGHGATMRSGGTVLGHMDLSCIASAYNFALMIPQSETERLMTRHLAGFGVTVERQVELQGFTEAGDHIDARLAHLDGRIETLRTPYLLGCDGAHSTVRHGVNAAFEGSTQDDEWLLADVRLEGPNAPPQDEIAIYFDRHGPFAIFPMPGGRARVIATVGKAVPGQKRPDPSLAEVQATLDDRTGGGFTATDPAWLSNFRINERKVTEYRHGRAFLAGDAAHVHSPAGGQGMNTGMQDAINLAWKLAMVTHGDARDVLLATYSPERSAVGDMVLRNATWLTDIATLASPAAQAVRNLVARTMLGVHAVRDKVAATMSEIEIAYPGSPLSHGHHAGARFAPAHYAGAPPGAGTRPRFVLCAAATAEAVALTSRFSTLLEPAPRLPVDAHHMHIVRPDGYVGLAAAAGAWREAERYLGALKGH
jgi:2-polyprenyl-6-methoxyphenol hydroxylase-like FAD-dependent oxidoreductase